MEKITAFQSIVALLLKQYRLEVNAKQAEFADHCGKQVSLWNKIENGSTPISLENILKVCFARQISVPHLFDLAENYRQFLQHNGWYVSINEKMEKDFLFLKSQGWFNHPQRIHFEMQQREFISNGFVVNSFLYPRIFDMPIFNSFLFNRNNPNLRGNFIVHPLFKFVVFEE